MTTDLVPVANAFYVPVEAIEPNPFQPRQHFGEAELEELAESIREHGVLQPILLRPHPTQPNRYQLVSGERRLRACQIIGRSEISALIRHLSDLESRQIALQENIQRQSLTDYEEALGLESLWKAYEDAGEKMSKRAIARKVSMNISYVSNRLDTLGYGEDVKAMLGRHRGVLSSARVINSVPEPQRRKKYIALVDKGTSFADVSRAIETDETQARVQRETHRAPDAQTQQRTALFERGEGGGGMISRGEVVTGGNQREADQEALRALANLEAWTSRVSDPTHEKILAFARRVTRGDLSR